jgi:hypothetical protein
LKNLLNRFGFGDFLGFLDVEKGVNVVDACLFEERLLWDETMGRWV